MLCYHICMYCVCDTTMSMPKLLLDILSLNPEPRQPTVRQTCVVGTLLSMESIQRAISWLTGGWLTRSSGAYTVQCQVYCVWRVVVLGLLSYTTDTDWENFVVARLKCVTSFEMLSSLNSHAFCLPFTCSRARFALTKYREKKNYE